MIVKVTANEKLRDMAIYNKTGDRLFYSDLAEDYKSAVKVLGGKHTPQYFQAMWMNKKVHLNKRVTGYDF